jgi:hypothetical protein
MEYSDQIIRTKRRRMISSSHLEMRLAFILVVACLPSFVQAQWCTQLADDTWSSFVEAVSDSSRLAVLCPFVISGDGCPSVEDYPQGYVLNGESDQIIIVCDPFLYSGGSYNSYSTECIIDCPGRHFTVGPSARLTLDSLVLAGATDSSVQVVANGRLEVVNSIFKE